MAAASELTATRFLGSKGILASIHRSPPNTRCKGGHHPHHSATPTPGKS